jgi:hypothetical protein
LRDKPGDPSHGVSEHRPYFDIDWGSTSSLAFSALSFVV